MLTSVTVMKIIYLHFSQTKITLNYIILRLITLLAYFAPSRNTKFLFMKDWLIFFTGSLNVLLGKKVSWGKNGKLKEREFLQLFVETSPNKLSFLPKKDNK